MKTLVTGAEGFIASHLVERLLDQGHDVRALVHYKPYASQGWLKDLDIEKVAGDVRDQSFVMRAVKGCDRVFHLAALIGIPYSYDAPESYVQTNVTGTMNVVTACREHDARLVHTSTSEVYGTARVVPIPESHPLQPQSPYSASKIAADMVALSFHHAFGTRVSVARPFNVYGPRQSARAVIPSILAQLHLGAKELKVGNTSPTRDFNYVTDTVRGFIAISESEQCVGEVVNIGSGTEASIKELIDRLQLVAGVNVDVVCEDERTRVATSEVERLVCDNTKIGALAGWEPRVPLEMGLRLTSAWVESNLGRFDTNYEK